MGHGKKKREKLALIRQQNSDLDKEAELLYDRGFRGDVSLPPCANCDCALVIAPISEVPPSVVATLTASLIVERFTYCLGCGNYSAQGHWEIF